MSCTRVKQSAIVPVSAEHLFDNLAKLDFSWWHLVQKAEFICGGPYQVNSMINLTFKDSATWMIRVISINNGADKNIDFEILEANPFPGYSSAIHQIQVNEVTMTKESFMAWTVDYSSDIKEEFIQDSKFKRQEALKHLIIHHAHQSTVQANPAAASMAAHKAAEEGKTHSHLHHVETHVRNEATLTKECGEAAAHHAKPL